MKTKHHEITENGIPYIIAEIGLNHNGDEALAVRMIEEAARCGAHCVKFQLYKSELFFDAKASLGDGPAGSLVDFFRQFELGQDVWRRLAVAADRNEVDFLCSVFDAESLVFYKELLQSNGHSTHYLKVASTDLTNRILLEQAKSLDFRILLSTGASNEDEVRRTLGWIGSPAVLFQCVSTYPASPAEYNLRLIPAWKERYGAAVGVSDHCEPLTVSFAAAALGAVAIERHFTIDRSLPGPDQSISSTPDQLRELREGLQVITDARGSGEKQSQPSEEGVRRFGRRALYYKRSLAVGDVLSADDVIALRPGVGIAVEEAAHYVGKRLGKSVSAGSLLQVGDFT